MFKNVFTSTALYSLASILPAIIGFLLLPVYLNILSVEQYGIYALINSFSAILGVVMGLKLESAYRVYYFDYSYEIEREKYFQTLFTSILVISSIISILIMVFGESIFDVAFGTGVNFFPYGLLSVVNIFIGSMNILYAIDCQNRENRKEYLWYSLTASAITICLQYIGIVLLGFGILSFFVALLVTGCVQLIYIVYKGKFKIRKIDNSMLRTSLKYTLPLIPFLFLLTAEQQLDRFFLKKYHTLELLGIYALLLTTGGIFSTIINSLDNAVRPRLFTSLKNKESEHNITYYQVIYVGVALLVVLSVMTLAFILPYWINNPKYFTLIKSIPLFGMSIIPLVYVRYFALLFSYKKDSANLTLISFLKLLVLVPVFYLLVPSYGIDGILLSLFIANVVNTSVFYWLIKHKHKLNVRPTYDLMINFGFCAALFIYWTQF
nr:oligosaccharide flippase family protein [Cytophagales bacterium]